MSICKPNRPATAACTQFTSSSPCVNFQPYSVLPASPYLQFYGVILQEFNFVVPSSVATELISKMDSQFICYLLSVQKCAEGIFLVSCYGDGPVGKFLFCENPSQIYDDAIRLCPAALSSLLHAGRGSTSPALPSNTHVVNECFD